MTDFVGGLSSTSVGYNQGIQLAEFIKHIADVTQTDDLATPANLRTSFKLMQTTSQQAIKELTDSAWNELLVGLCQIHGYRLHGEREFSNWACPVVSFELPLNIVVDGALIDIKKSPFNSPGSELIITEIATNAPFALVVDAYDLIQVSQLTRTNIKVISGNYFERLMAGVLAVNYWQQVYEEIYDRSVAIEQLKEFLNHLGLQAESVQSITRKLLPG